MINGHHVIAFGHTVYAYYPVRADSSGRTASSLKAAPLYRRLENNLICGACRAVIRRGQPGVHLSSSGQRNQATAAGREKFGSGVFLDHAG